MWLGPVTLPGIGLRADETLSFAPHGETVWVYYIDAPDQHISRVRLDGSQRQVVLQGALSGEAAIIGAYRKSEDAPWQLWQAGVWRQEPRMLLDDFAAHAGAVIDSDEPQHPSYWSSFWGPQIVDLRAEGSSPWIYRYRYYHGLRAERNDHDRQVELFGFDTPFGSWRPLAVTVLPSEIVIFEMAKRVVVWDVEARHYGVLAQGRSPVVAYERAPDSEGR